MPDGARANLWGSFAADDRGSDPWSVLYNILGTDGGVTYTWDEAYTSEVNKPGWDKPASSAISSISSKIRSLRSWIAGSHSRRSSTYFGLASQDWTVSRCGMF